MSEDARREMRRSPGGLTDDFICIHPDEFSLPYCLPQNFHKTHRLSICLMILWFKAKLLPMPWKKVNVSLDDPEDSEKNHYDHSDVKVSSKDLPVEPGEQVAIFNGLEVLSGDSYKVEILDGKTSFTILDNPSPNEKHTKPNAEKASKATTKKVKKQSVLKQDVGNTDGGLVEDKKDRVLKPDTSSSKVNAHKKKKTKKKKPKGKSNSSTEVPAKTVTSTGETSEETISLQSSWCGATGGVLLHLKICNTLLKNEFWTPTPIQAATLPAAILGRCDILGAAPTGSGKTLAYILPIVQHLLDANLSRHSPLQALILTPTRELALQVEKVGKAFASIGCIVGGLAQAKQARVLDVDRPTILVGTVGRLWELMSSREHPHLNDLSQLRFLVLDEADRMNQQGSFEQLRRILDAVHRANPMTESDDEDMDDVDEEDCDRMLGLPGIRGEAKVTMLSDNILNELAKQRQEPAEANKPKDDEYEEESKHEYESESDEDAISLPSSPPVHRQTFIFSATLTLPGSEKSKKRKRTDTSVLDGAIAQLVEIAHAGGKAKIVDLSHSEKPTTKATVSNEKKKQKKDPNDRFRLPPGLRLQQIKCTQLHKDSHLYAYLMTTKEGRSGPCLVFCNSIAAVKRVGTTLQTLGIQTKMLHANMQQVRWLGC
ncbi:ATP-dependent RNA helicase DDX24/MAK5 [Fistulifera solaris]|uniref:ATP-dependent RNA helicase n=1 Tax=Fistulifera solaris TaxID=1519565 RepID=A0A1Z5JC63_FISSO|nr:ATP-dependent RNA helicase DDX24/MAK5 [Fistulifera solaris]|eukprot:GAX11546.1 ATP-dependent RNA helicase DDX24/MAK5 [Fistulifera solaris]